MQVRGPGVWGQGADTPGGALAQEPGAWGSGHRPTTHLLCEWKNSNPSCCSRRACGLSGATHRQGSSLWSFLSCPVLS